MMRARRMSVDVEYRIQDARDARLMRLYAISKQSPAQRALFELAVYEREIQRRAKLARGCV